MVGNHWTSPYLPPSLLTTIKCGMLRKSGFIWKWVDLGAWDMSIISQNDRNMLVLSFIFLLSFFYIPFFFFLCYFIYSTFFILLAIFLEWQPCHSSVEGYDNTTIILFVWSEWNGANKNNQMKSTLWRKRNMFGTRIKIMWEEQIKMLLIINIAKPMLCHSSQCYHYSFSLFNSFFHFFVPFRSFFFIFRFEIFAFCSFF